MRKFRFAIRFLAVIAAALTFGIGTAQAAPGDKALGLMGGYAGYNDGGYANVYFHYDVINHVRLAPSIGYAFRNKGKSGVLFDVDVHFPFRLVKGIGVYPMLGPTLQSWHYEGSDSSATRFGFDFGGGLEFFLTRNLKLSVEGKYSLMNDTSGCFFGFGMGYMF